MTDKDTEKEKPETTGRSEDEKRQHISDKLDALGVTPSPHKAGKATSAINATSIVVALLVLAGAGYIGTEIMKNRADSQQDEHSAVPQPVARTPIMPPMPMSPMPMMPAAPGMAPPVSEPVPVAREESKEKHEEKREENQQNVAQQPAMDPWGRPYPAWQAPPPDWQPRARSQGEADARAVAPPANRMPPPRPNWGAPPRGPMPPAPQAGAQPSPRDYPGRQPPAMPPRYRPGMMPPPYPYRGRPPATRGGASAESQARAEMHNPPRYMPPPYPYWGPPAAMPQRDELEDLEKPRPHTHRMPFWGSRDDSEGTGNNKATDAGTDTGTGANPPPPPPQPWGPPPPYYGYGYPPPPPPRY